MLLNGEESFMVLSWPGKQASQRLSFRWIMLVLLLLSTTNSFLLTQCNFLSKITNMLKREWIVRTIQIDRSKNMNVKILQLLGVGLPLEALLYKLKFVFFFSTIFLDFFKVFKRTISNKFSNINRKFFTKFSCVFLFPKIV